MKRRQVSDRVFFSQSPARRFRIRPPFPGELAELRVTVPAGALASIIISRIAPGVRLRFAVIHIARVPAALRHDDDAIEALAALVRG